MRIALLFLVVAAGVSGCATAPASRRPLEGPRPVEVAPPRPPPHAAALAEADVIARSHAWFDAIDRADLAGFDALLGPTFVQFERSRFLDRQVMDKGIQTRIDQHQPIRSRTWSDEHVMTSPSAAVFIGQAEVSRPATADAPASSFTGYYTLVWVPEGDRWVIAHSQWQRTGIEAERADWDDAFKQGAGFNKKPNQLLVDTVKGRKPGTALDVLMGQGRNALYLASQGWKTTGVDISDEGIRQAQAEAARQKLKLDAVNADIDKYDFGKEKWDLVTMIYAGDDEKLVERIKPSLKKGGLFVLEYFSAEGEIAKTGAGGWKTGVLASHFKDGFKVLRDEVVEDNADWAGMRKTKLVRFVAQKL